MEKRFKRFRIERGDASIVVPEASDAELRHREVLGAIAELRALLSRDVLKVGQRRLGLS